MKVKLLSPYSCKDGSFGAGETIEVDDNTAYRMAKSGLAELVGKNAKSFLEKMEAKLEEERKQVEIEAAQREKERLEKELDALYEQVVEKEALLAGVKLTKKQKSELVEGLKNREAKAGK